MRTLLIVCGLLTVGPALAYKPVPEKDFVKRVPGGKYILVMLTAENSELLKKYGQSGLYPADGSTRPIWAFDGFTHTARYPESMFAASDGEYAGCVREERGHPSERNYRLEYGRIQPPPRSTGFEAGTALWVYRNGRLHRELKLSDVFDCSRFSDRDCFMGPVVALDSFDDAARLVVISTEHSDGGRQTATVDYRTGEVVNRTSVPPTLVVQAVPPATPESGVGWAWLWAGVTVIGVIVTTVVVVVIIRRQTRRR